jgi:NitT/TauT family transport system permease protein
VPRAAPVARGAPALVNKRSWFQPFGEVTPRQRIAFTVASLLLPLALWCAVSYLPFLWHPMMRITDPGDVGYFVGDQLVERDTFEAENARLRETGGEPALGVRANPVFLPAPHEVARAFHKAFTTEPRRTGDPWLHESLWHSIRVIFWGFFWSCVFGVPLGVLCGTFPLFSRLHEPFVEFIRYMPAPVFGALAVAVLGIHDAPKIAIIYIGTFFQMVLVIANTTRKMDTSLIEAAQTLGARRPQLLFKVVVPGIVVDLYNDLRILLGWAWTYLIVAEYIGASSGITFFINQQARYRIYDNVFAAIILIGLIGLLTDLILAWISRQIFPWRPDARRNLLGIALHWLLDGRESPLPARTRSSLTNA